MNPFPLRVAILTIWVAFALANSVCAQSGLNRLGEFKINSTTAGNQTFPQMARDGAGNVVVVWQGTGGIANGSDIFVKQLDPFGTPKGTEIRVNTATAADQAAPSVACAPDGRFVVTWYSDGTSDQAGVFARRFNADGSPRDANQIRVTESAGTLRYPQVAMDSAGNFVVVWAGYGLEGDSPDAANVYLRRFSDSGSRLGNEQRVNNSVAGDQTYPQIASTPDGNFVVVFRNLTSNYDIYFRRYAADGTPLSVDDSVHVSPAGGQYNAALAVATDGSFIVAWDDDLGTNNAFTTEIRARRFNAAGTGGSVINVNTYTDGRQNPGGVALRDNGEFIVTWRSEGIDNAGEGVAARRFSAINQPLDTDDFVVNTFTAGSQSPAQGQSISYDSDGNIFSVWASQGQDGDQSGIYADVFYRIDAGPPPDEFRVNTTTAGDQRVPAIAMNPSGQTVVVWEAPDGSGTGIFAQRYDASGRRVGTEMLINNDTAGEQSRPAVAIDADGTFSVVWVNVGQGLNPDEIYLRRFTFNGLPDANHPVAEKVNIANGPNRVENFPTCPNLAVSPEGRIAVIWWGTATSGAYAPVGSGFRVFAPDGSPAGPDHYFAADTFRITGASFQGEQLALAWGYLGQIKVQYYDQNGEQLPGPETLVSQVGDPSIYPAITFGSMGKALVVWPFNLAGAPWPALFGRFIEADRQLGARLEPISSSAGEPIHSLASIAALPDGSFALVYGTTGDGSDQGVALQLINAAGQKQGGQVFVNKTRAGSQRPSDWNRAVAADSLGNYMVVWSSQDQDGSGAGVYARKVTVNAPPSVTTLDASNVAGATATLRAKITARGVPATVAFEYDEDPSFSSPNVVQVPGVYSELGEQEVSPTTVLGLTKGITYYFRAKATVGTQVIFGGALSFVPANAKPVANADVVFVPFSQVTFAPLQNDTDADQSSATLTMVDYPQEVVSEPGGNAMGTISLVPGTNSLSFRANQFFLDSAQFTYRAMDDDGALSDPAAVTLVRFSTVSGTYQGLVEGDAGAGSLVISVNGAAGAFTGNLLFDNVRYAFDGRFNSDGTFADAIGSTGLGLFLSISADGSVTGELKDGSGQVVGSIALDRLDGGGDDGFRPETGLFTTFLDLDDASSSSLAENAVPLLRPGGSGFLAITVGKTRKFPARFVGALPDALKFSAGSAGIARRKYTLAQQLYAVKRKDFRGSIVGQPTFRGQDGGSSRNRLDARLRWTKGNTSGKPGINYPLGFGTVGLLLEALTFKRTGRPINFNPNNSPNVRIDFSDGGLADSSFATFYINGRNVARLQADANALSPKLTLGNRPAFSGSFVPPGATKRIKFRGVFKQGGTGGEDGGSGHFVNTEPDEDGGTRKVTGKVKIRLVQ